MVQGLHHGLHPVVLIQKAEVVHGGARRGQHALVLIGHHVMKQGNGVGGDASNRRVRTSASPRRTGVPHGREGNESPRVPAQRRVRPAEQGRCTRWRRLPVQDRPLAEQDVNEAQGFDERRALKQELNPADEQEAAVNVTLFQARQDPRCGFSTGGVASTSVFEAPRHVGSSPCAEDRRQVACATSLAVVPKRWIRAGGILRGPWPYAD